MIVGLAALAVLLTFLSSGEAVAAPPATPDPASSDVHHVRSGDTLLAIARRYGTTVPSLVEANRLRSASARLKVGSRLTIPVGGSPRPAVQRKTTRPETSAQHKNPPQQTLVRRRAAPEATVAPRKTPARRNIGEPTTSRLAPAVATGADRSSSRARVRRAALVATPPGHLVLAVPDFAPTAPAFVWPVEGAVSSNFGRRRQGWHRGVDIVAPPGTPIIASAPGLVIASGVEGRYGRVVKIAHDNGFITVYAHNEQNRVELGDWVSAGQTIATVGRTGRATSEHIHFEIRHEGRSYNPLYLLPEPPRIAAHVEQTDADDDEEDE